MTTGEVITTILLLIVSLANFIISYFQSKEKGFLFNNAYLYASKEERETMNKKPHYRQSAIVFLLLGVTFLLLAAEIIFAVKWLYPVVGFIIISVVIYAIVSSITIEKNEHSTNKSK